MKDILFDVDGTLLDIQHRVHLIRPTGGGRKDWKAFRAQAANDSPILPIVFLAQTLYNQHDVRIIISTGRMEEERKVTVDTLAAAGVNFHKMYMRRQDDHRPDAEVKSQMLAQMWSDGYHPMLVFDDRRTVVDMWRDNGLICCQVAPGEF